MFEYVPLPVGIWDEDEPMTLGEMRLLGYLLRLQLALGEERVTITDEELRHGRKGEDGRRLDQGCGIKGVNNLREAKERLLAKKWLKEHPGKTYTTKFKIEFEPRGTVSESDSRLNVTERPQLSETDSPATKLSVSDSKTVTVSETDSLSTKVSETDGIRNGYPAEAPPPTPPSPSRSPKGTVTETQNFVPSGREANASSGEAGQAKAAKRGSGEPHPETQRLMVAYGEALNRPGGHIPARGQNGKSAKALLQAGYTVEQVMGCYAWVKSDPWWKHKLVTLTEIEKQIGEWVNAGQPETWSKPGGGYSGATGGSSGYRGTSSRGGTGAGRLQPAGGNNLAKLAERDRDEVAQYLANLGVELPPGSGSD